MNIKCPSCAAIFQANAQEQERINNAIAKGQKLLMMDCSVCYKSIPIKPTDLLATQEKKEETTIKCPICKDGLVSFVDDGVEKFWGCGECGSIWQRKEELAKNA